MKKSIVLAAVIAIAFFALAMKTAGSTETAPIETKVEKADILTHRQRAWLGALEWCEGRGDPAAVNPNDTDDTPSYGILQFKPSTYEYYRTRYALEISADYMDADGQERIVEQMIARGDVSWQQQFPACTRKLGIPPLSPELSTESIYKK